MRRYRLNEEFHNNRKRHSFWNFGWNLHPGFILRWRKWKCLVYYSGFMVVWYTSTSTSKLQSIYIFLFFFLSFFLSYRSLAVWLNVSQSVCRFLAEKLCCILITWMMSLFKGLKSHNKRDDYNMQPCKFTMSIFCNCCDISLDKLVDRWSGCDSNRAMLPV